MLVSFGPIFLTLAFSANSSHAPKPPRDPFELFVKSCRPRRDLNVVALIDQRDAFGGGWQRVKLIRDKRGYTFKHVLYPLSMQGVKSLDDGKCWRTLLPDQHEFIDQVSPRDEKHALPQKLKLARQNYQFAFSGQKDIAEHHCFVISVTPHYSRLPSWTLYVDSATDYPLRVDVSDSKRHRLEFIYRSVDFPRHLEPIETSFDIPEDFRRICFDAPKYIRTLNGARERLGFEPILPTQFPLGFELQDMRVDCASSVKSVIFRLSDGMARASVYEYLLGSEPKEKPLFENSSETMIDGVEIMIVANISAVCRGKLLASFTARKD